MYTDLNKKIAHSLIIAFLYKYIGRETGRYSETLEYMIKSYSLLLQSEVPIAALSPTDFSIIVKKVYLKRAKINLKIIIFSNSSIEDNHIYIRFRS